MNKKITILLAFLLALVSQVTFAYQQNQISGTVKDSDGLPLPGVNVLVKGTDTGVQTDFDGNYAIDATEGDILVFSFVGLKTAEYPVSNVSTIDVTMEEDASQLSEVVVTALGIERDKQSLGFAQQTVEGNTLVKSRQTDLNNALAGKVAGVQFNGAASSGFDNSNIRLRGNTGVLYIVDNIKVGSSSNINTDDIAEMSILKGAAATALYGPEGINGVIIITTKSAKSGESIITINHSTAVENVAELPEYQNIYGGGYKQTFNTFSYDPSVHPESWASFDGQSMVEYYADESWGPKMEGQMVRHWDSWIQGQPEFGELRPFSPNPDNVKNFFRTGITNNTNLTFSKGGEEYSIRASIARVERKSIIPGADQNRIQATMNATLDITEKLQGFANVSYQDRRTTNFVETGYGNIASNFNQWWQRQLDIDRLKDYRRGGQVVSWNINSPTNARPLYWDSPYLSVNEAKVPQTKNSLYGKIGISYDFYSDLTGSIELRKNYEAYESTFRSPWGGLNTPAYGEGESYESTDELFGILNYDHDLNDDFDITANVGFELQDYNFKNINASTTGGLQADGFYSLNTSVGRPNVSSYKEDRKRQSVFSKASIGFKGILFLDGSARLDWQSTATPSDNRVETYGGSFSFIFSKLLEQNDLINFGKLRGSFAQAPQFPDIYDIVQTYDVGTPYSGYGSLSYPGTLVNPSLIGGVREEMEFGTEFKLLNSRIGLDVTYFEKTDERLPVSVSLDGSTGYTATRSNDGKQTYNGWEISLNLVPARTDDFEWNFTTNFATLERTVDQISPGINTNVLASTWGGTSLQERTGEEWGAIYGRKYSRDEDGNILLSSSGQPRYESSQYLGNVLPDFTGGMSHYLQYKNLSLSFDIDFQKGGKIFSTTKMFNAYSGLSTETVGNNNLGNPLRDPVTDGANSGGVFIEGVDENSGEPVSYHVDAQTYYESYMFGLAEEWLYNNSYVKLRQARIDYTIPKNLLTNTPFKDINIGAYANNLWLIYSSIDGIDTSEIEDPDYAWTEGGQLPMARTIGLNVTLSF
ncbi:SusC/RagA family TonB-linked outer membrane protein [Zunongwangia sp. HGR-M22]|uniref:SusC/RagA family TonB-linked outer membrane protein n=1 Tax=Zunongwangia sp. HGR-M22 TaxID=3015168 RepID=UPI0022DD129C|nr:SusC/RagA family TonB-linked outer membrane protein [Zunongwangia sp. HGR-M22]WBL26178.1 SusC/RagA family TonB-linked outer membrane protein [Zunongwangia sp. HGR-M22]